MIEVKGLRHAYDNGQAALENVSFSIEKGERVVLLGSNGCGKTTLLKILDALIHPTAGEFVYKGTPVNDSALKNASFRRTFRKEVALLFQNPDAMIFNPTVLDEIAFGPRQHRLGDAEDRARKWAGELGLTRHIERAPFELSRGEKQKLCLAALLAVEPELLLLDEPTANLDPRTTGWLIDFLQDAAVTTFVTTHNLSLAVELGERTLVLSEVHEILYDGPLEPLLDDTEKLIEANLVHVHRHRHGELDHKHFHTHDWD